MLLGRFAGLGLMIVGGDGFEDFGEGLIPALHEGGGRRGTDREGAGIFFLEHDLGGDAVGGGEESETHGQHGLCLGALAEVAVELADVDLKESVGFQGAAGIDDRAKIALAGESGAQRGEEFLRGSIQKRGIGVADVSEFTGAIDEGAIFKRRGDFEFFDGEDRLAGDGVGGGKGRGVKGKGLLVERRPGETAGKATGQAEQAE